MRVYDQMKKEESAFFFREYWKHTKYPSIKAKNPTFFSAFLIQNCYPHLSPVLADCRMPDVGVPPLERNNQRWTQYDVRAHVGRKSQQVGQNTCVNANVCNANLVLFKTSREKNGF